MQQMMTNVETDKLEILTYPIWSNSQIMFFTGIKSRTTVIKLKKRAFEEYDGKVPYGSQYVKRDAILSILGTNVENERAKLTRNY